MFQKLKEFLTTPKREVDYVRPKNKDEINLRPQVNSLTAAWIDKNKSKK